MSKINMNRELKHIETSLAQLMHCEDPTLQQASEHLLSSGGKRVRPLFVILSSYLTGARPTDATYRVAAALELIHMATLVHDDVIDLSDKRRGKTTVEFEWSQSTAILTGNFLLSRAIAHLAAIENYEIHRTLSHAIIEVCRGELFQFQDQFRTPQSLTNYLRRIKRKTALLIQLATEVGAMSANADQATVKCMRDIGYNIGMSFQIVDDILDFTSTEKKLGKPVGSDLRNGHLTLPTLLEMKKDPVFKQRVEQLHANASQEAFEVCINQVRHSDAIMQSKRVSEKYLQRAKQLLNTLPENDAKPLFNKLILKLQNRMK
ncbi:polyprenyl synthetase family protein [Staphylococcus agnetis]|uniref:Polyprenyl synthetase family protein n=1 Tax=Staphylococcus agnetis TaxID=985762 RepID=A0ABD7TTV5_9STAP|nr:polyprenyl synthetase family protein [Staphylococcus agnetis]UXU53971.1 polyprenyl synthetase family protein [Staphylococcus agnetis]UXU56225.1 polyprenyl synthetase family protein [Staphylococcus agnetis]UXU63198.1 polyprenyl synthetase family protein [Staphylococcus agnetis]UXU65537.1 polyprenyl synthetase family protein [Staphylococcus agnetis]